MDTHTEDTGKSAQTDLQQILEQGLGRRLPLTFLPFLNQELYRWDVLFPFERRYLRQMLEYLEGLDVAGLEALFRTMREIETRMGVPRWRFSTQRQTLENSTLLARSPYYPEWRTEVRNIFAQIEREASNPNETGSRAKNRLLLLVLPARLQLDPATVWRHWENNGRELVLDPRGISGNRSLLETLLGVGNPSGQPSFLKALSNSPGWSHDDIWFLEGSPESASLWNELSPAGDRPPSAVLLSFLRLKALRENMLRSLDNIRKDLANADLMFAKLRKLEIEGWLPQEVAAEPVVREFVREVFLSGNGAMNFANSFVQWAASEGIRRARPSVLIARFGMRNKPKPFTSVLTFANQEEINPLPDVEDSEGSALDAQVMARYTWLTAARYPEYQRAACLCVAENLPQAFLTAPPEFPLWKEAGPIQIERLPLIFQEWLHSPA